MDETKFTPRGHVRVLRDSSIHRKGDVLTIAVVVTSGYEPDFNGSSTSTRKIECAGLIFTPSAGNRSGNYPYVWNLDRFEVITENEYQATLLDQQAAALRHKDKPVVFEADDEDED
jgi:hypothetical protein